MKMAIESPNQLLEKNMLLIFIILFLSLRLAFLLTDISQIWNFEELYAGGLAHGIISGPLIKPISNYQQSPWEVGHLLGGFLVIPFFFLFGQSLVSLKLLPILFSLGTFIVWFLFLKKFFSSKAALIFGFLFIFSPPYYTKLTLVFWSSHCEASFFSILSTFIFFLIFFENKKDLKYFFLFGIVSGIGLCFSYIHLIAVISCIIFWYLIDKLFILKKSFICFIIGFVIGLIPWIVYNVSCGFKGLYVYGKPVITINYSISNSISKLINIITQAIPNSLGFTTKRIQGIELFSNLYFLIFAISLLFLIYNLRRNLAKSVLAMIPSERFKSNLNDIPKELFLFIYIALFILMMTLSPLYGLPSSFAADNPGSEVYNYRYIIPLFPFLFATISIGLINFKNLFKKFGMIFFSLFVIYLISLGIYENSRLISADKLGKGLIFKGYDYYLPLERKIKRLNGKKDFFKGLEILEKADNEYKLVGYHLLGENISYKTVAKEISLIEKVNKKYKRFFLEGLGSSLTNQNKLNPEQIAISLKILPNNYMKSIYEGYGKEIGKKYQKITYLPYDPREEGLKVHWDISKCIEEINKLDEAFRSYAYIGLGEHICSWDLYYHLWKGLKIISGIKECYRPYCFLGYALEFGRMRFGFVAESEELCFIQGINKKFFSPQKIPERLNEFYNKELNYKFYQCKEIADLVEDKYKPYIYKGIGIAAIENFNDFRTLNFLKNRAEQKYLPSFNEGIEEGMS